LQIVFFNGKTGIDSSSLSLLLPTDCSKKPDNSSLAYSTQGSKTIGDMDNQCVYVF